MNCSEKPDSSFNFRASGGYIWTGGYRVFLVAIEGFVYQVVAIPSGVSK